MLKLDVGCGHLINHFARGMVNIDIQKPPVRPANFILADAHYLPFKNNCFDKVFFYDVIEHVETPLKCLKEISRTLKKDGQMEISTPNPLHYRRFFRVARGRKLELTGSKHIATWTQAEMEILLELAGFQDPTITYSILKSTEISDSRKHILIDKLMFKILPSSISGLGMIVTCQKSR